MSSNLVCNEGEHLSPYFPCQSPTSFIGNSSNHHCQKQHCNLQLCLQITCEYVCNCDRSLFNSFKHANIKGVRSRAQRPLPQLSLRAPYSYFKWRILTFTRWNWKCYVMINTINMINTLRPRQIDAISQTTFSNAFSWMKMFEFRLKFHWSLFPRVQLTISWHWFR